MVYKKQFALAIKHSGKILRENGEKVYLPFGSEYEIVLKNLNSVRAKVKVQIDGVDISDGYSIEVGPNKSIDLERFIRDNKVGNKFKFIERSEAIENNRGIKIEDGIVRIEYQFEKIIIPQYIPPLMGQSYYAHQPEYCSSEIRGASSIQCYSANAISTNNIGITVPGSISNQRFETSTSFITEQETFSLCLHLVGMTDKLVEKPVLVSSKFKCSSCGKLNKSNYKFCSECGTSLTIF
jgi:hypothetical protein